MNSTNRPTRSEQREAARAKAKALREQHKRQEKARKFAIRLGVVGAVLGVAAIVVVAIVGGLNGGSENGASNGDSKPKNMSFGNGIKIGAGLEAFTAMLCLARRGESEENIPAHTLPSMCAFDMFPRLLVSEPLLLPHWE